MRAALLLLILLSPAGLGLAHGREPRTIDELIKRVVAVGADDVFDVGTASLLGLTKDAPIRVTWQEGSKRAGFIRRGLAVAYNSPKKGKIEPAALILLVTDRMTRTREETRILGWAYLADLDGKLARALRTEHWQQGKGRGEDDTPIALHSPNGERRFRKELRFWLESSDEAAWRGRR